jgi:uncharacterized integral membrane protein (TIGR00697 family)
MAIVSVSWLPLWLQQPLALTLALVAWGGLQVAVLHEVVRLQLFSKRHGVFIVLLSIFLSTLLVANLTGSVLLEPLGWMGSHQLVSGGILTFPLTFIITDVVNEFYGAVGARVFTWLGLMVALGCYLAFSVLNVSPISLQSVLPKATYLAISGAFTHLLLASLTAYVLGQLLDIALFSMAKRLTQGKWLWLRATGSTVVSQVFDSFIVVFIAFWGTLSTETMVNIAVGNYWVKLAVVLATTPLLYGVHYVIRQQLNVGKVK